MSLCPVWALQLNPLRSKRLPVVGISVLISVSIPSFKNVAMQPSEKPIAAPLFAIQTSSYFFSNASMKSDKVDEYFASPESRFARSTSATFLFTIRFQKFRFYSSKTSFSPGNIFILVLNQPAKLRSSSDPSST